MCFLGRPLGLLPPFRFCTSFSCSLETQHQSALRSSACKPVSGFSLHPQLPGESGGSSLQELIFGFRQQQGPIGSVSWTPAEGPVHTASAASPLHLHLAKTELKPEQSWEAPHSPLRKLPVGEGSTEIPAFISQTA